MSLVDMLAAMMLLVTVQVQAPYVPSWTDTFTDHTGMRCCQRECEPAEVALASEARSEVWVNGVLLTLPSGSMYPMPAEAPLDVSGWVCWRNKWAWPSPSAIRCVWFRPGMF